MTRPRFLDQPESWTRSRRESLSRADYASPVTRYKHERSWLWSDRVIALLLICVIAAIAVGAV